MYSGSFLIHNCFSTYNLQQKHRVEKLCVTSLKVSCMQRRLLEIKTNKNEKKSVSFTSTWLNVVLADVTVEARCDMTLFFLVKKRAFPPMRQWILRVIIIRATWVDWNDYILKILYIFHIFFRLLNLSLPFISSFFSLSVSFSVSLLRPPYSTLRLNAPCSV